MNLGIVITIDSVAWMSQLSVKFTVNDRGLPISLTVFETSSKVMDVSVNELQYRVRQRMIKSQGRKGRASMSRIELSKESKINPRKRSG